jgi:hypothetical protein
LSYFIIACTLDACGTSPASRDPISKELGVDPIVARTTWRVAEAIHGMIYFAPEAHERYAALGLIDATPGLIAGRMGYFASRAAALGPVPPEVVVATFFNFWPGLVGSVIPEAWTIADPAKILQTRLEAVDAALRRAFGDATGSPDVSEAAALARRAAESACDHPQGRPLFAAHAALPWPDEPHLVLWHAQTLLREFRGDGHISALLVEGLSGVQALVVHAATGDVPATTLKATRAWPDDDWDTAVEQLRERGWIEPGEDLALTAAGRAHRAWVESRTDLLALPAYEPLGEKGCLRLRALARPLSLMVIDAGLLPTNPARVTFLIDDD